MNKVGRNKPCPCGSGKKYKRCCLYEALQAIAISGNSYRNNEFVDDFPTEEVEGLVLENDGTTAIVQPFDDSGLQTTFFRDRETKEEFLRMFPDGQLVKMRRLRVND